jgi:hypothetical protein
VRYQGSPSAPAVLDYASYILLSADRSFGAIPDGEPRRRRLLHFPTPGAPNNLDAPSIQVTINEFMALNSSTIQDPVDGSYEDWFELYNAGSEDVDLTAYSLTDNVTNASQFVIPPGYVVPAGGFLLVWADNDANQNSPTNTGLHVNFARSGAGAQIGCCAPDGSLVDSLTFGPQSSDVSEGLYPDGNPPPALVLDIPTPGASNSAWFGPEIDALSWNAQGEPVLSWLSATDRNYELQFKNALTDSAWGSIGTVAGTGGRVSLPDSTAAGQPQRFYRLVETAP